MRAPAPTTVRQAAEAWLEGARAGTIRTRSGDPYKPSAIRSYESALRLRILDDLGAVRLVDVSRRDVQDLADRMLAEGLDPSTIRNALMPLRAIYRRAVIRGEVVVNPTRELELPAVAGTRDRVAAPQEAAKLIAAVPEGDRAVWACAFYAGLRLGELRALRFEDVDLEARLIRVERSWDPKVGPVAPKSKKGRRLVPISAVLRRYLLEHQVRVGRREGLVFGRSGDRPFNPSSVYARAAKTWGVAKLEPIGLHEARHTYASLMIAASVNIKAISTFMGHASVQITWDRYGHLFPGTEDAAAALLDRYLEQATGAQTGAHVAESQ